MAKYGGKPYTVTPEGFTVNTRGKPMQQGYAVAVSQKPLILPEFAPGRMGIGGWRDPDTGEFLVEAVCVVHFDHIAEHLAKELNQKAYYDLELEKEVWIQ